jgi:ATP-dependent HslUV protease subunit HslV
MRYHNKRSGRYPSRSTTIVAVKMGGTTAIAGDGQVSVGDTVLKSKAVKIRKLYKDRVVVGFAGASADALALVTRFEAKLEESRGNLERAVVELAKDWRTDRILRRLEALLIVADKEKLFLLSGTGDVIEPDDGVLGIGSGGPYALAAARALMRHSNLGAKEIAVEALKISAEICVYTNDQITLEVL